MIIVYIIGVLIVIGIIHSIFEKLSEMVGGGKTLAFLIIIYLVSFLALSWIGVLAATIVLGIVALIRSSGRYVGKVIKDHDNDKKTTARINQDTQKSKEIHDNDTELNLELERNCKQLGYMTEKMWKAKLPNYVNRIYSTSFEERTRKFAEQIEQQNIRQNDDWFQPFINYLLAHSQGATVVKMLHEVKCPQFNYTHTTPNSTILKNRLLQGTKKIQRDVPPSFIMTPIEGMGEIFQLSAYGKKQYGGNTFIQQEEKRVEEINFDDL